MLEPIGDASCDARSSLINECSKTIVPKGDSSGRIESSFVIGLGRARKRLRRGAEREPRGAAVLRSLALAEELRARLDGSGVTRADLAREHKISRARVTQLLALLSLPPAVLAWIRECGGHEPRLSERLLRPLLDAPPKDQLRVLALAFPSFRRMQRARA